MSASVTPADRDTLDALIAAGEQATPGARRMTMAQTHDDWDSNSALSELRKRAEEMSARGENLITAGAPTEQIVAERAVSGFGIVRRLPGDPLCLRVSIGEATFAAGDGAYLVYRGDRAAVEALLRRALSALRVAT